MRGAMGARAMRILRGRPHWYGNAGGMVVSKNNRCCIVLERGLHDFAGINRGLGERAAKHLLTDDEPMLSVKEEDDEHFPFPFGDSKTKVIAHGLRTIQRQITVLEASFHNSERPPDHGVVGRFCTF